MPKMPERRPVPPKRKRAPENVSLSAQQRAGIIRAIEAQILGGSRPILSIRLAMADAGLTLHQQNILGKEVLAVVNETLPEVSQRLGVTVRHASQSRRSVFVIERGVAGQAAAQPMQNERALRTEKIAEGALAVAREKRFERSQRARNALNEALKHLREEYEAQKRIIESSKLKGKALEQARQQMASIRTQLSLIYEELPQGYFATRSWQEFWLDLRHGEHRI